MQILEMCLSDLREVTALAAQLGYAENLGTIEARFSSIDQTLGHKLWVAKLPNAEIVGWLHVNCTNTWLICDPVAEICAVVVKDSHRGQGIGTALFAKAEEWARENGLRQMKLYTNIGREKAHDFYKRAGFVRQKTSFVFLKDI